VLTSLPLVAGTGTGPMPTSSMPWVTPPTVRILDARGALVAEVPVDLDR
jgi:hypothetical protein